jgi:hypothetical protein
MERIRHFISAVLTVGALTTVILLIVGVHSWGGRWAVLPHGVVWYFTALTLSPYCILVLIARLGSRNVARSVVVLVSSSLVAMLGIGSMIYAGVISPSRAVGFEILFAVVAEWIVCGLTAIVIACIPVRMVTLSSFAYGRWTARVIECTLAIWIILFLVTSAVGGGLEGWAILFGWLPGWILGVAWESHARKKAQARESNESVERTGSNRTID